MRIGGTRDFDVESWGAEGTDPEGDISATGNTVSATHNARISTVASTTGAINASACPASGARNGSVQLQDGQRACVTTSDGNTVMIQRHADSALPYVLFNTDLNFVTHP